MKDTTETICGRNDDLIAFLYHELGEKDARDFQRHMRECARCESEVASLGEIRESIVSWRDASLGAAWSTGVVNDRRFASAATAPVAPIRRSAVAAIREFFSLSPMWMKGAAAFASLLFCLCAVLAVAFLRDRNSVVVQAPSDKIYSKQELDTRVASAVQKKVDELKNQPAKGQSNDDVVSSSPRTTSNRPGQMQQAGYRMTAQGLRKPLTRQERRELAADLGLLVSRDDDDLDLVTDKITQTP